MTRAAVTGTPVRTLTRSRRLAAAPLGVGLLSGPQFVSLRLSKTHSPLSPRLSRALAPRLPILRITRGIHFLGHPLPRQLMVGYRLDLSDENWRGLRRSVIPFCVTLGWYSTPCPSYVAGRNQTQVHCLAAWRHVPFWACRGGYSPSLAVRQVLTHDASNIPLSPIHSHLLEASPLSASSLSPLHPCTPPLVCQTTNVGRGCHTSTGWVGVALLYNAHRHETTVIKVPLANIGQTPMLTRILHRSSPMSLDIVSSERLARTRVRRTA